MCYNIIMNEGVNWKISESQKRLLDDLFSVIVEEKIQKVIDMGAGRTSIQYLTDRFKDIIITGIVYPGDLRKIDPAKECVTNTNYEIVEQDILDFDENQEIDIVLGHLFLGEAEKFAGNKFGQIVEKLFSINTKYLVIVNLFRDSINYNLLLKQIFEKGEIVKIGYTKSESGDECLGMTIKFNSLI